MEQRRATRYDVKAAAEIYTSNDVFSAFTQNLSTSGVCINTNSALQEGSAVGISLFLTDDGIEDPDVEPLNVRGMIVWCTEREDSGFAAGIRFDNMSADKSRSLEQYLEAIARAQ